QPIDQHGPFSLSWPTAASSQAEPTFVACTTDSPGIVRLRRAAGTRRRREKQRAMEAALRGIRAKLTEHREKVISGLLLGSFVALGWWSSEQQREIDDLEAEKNSLRAANSSMSSAMWAWREELFALAAAPSPPISTSRLRHIYGEEEPAVPAPKQPGSDAEEETISIAVRFLAFSDSKAGFLRSEGNNVLLDIHE
ncbi:hypothetical protein EJB05_46240, partial [Eragrostis curvula]